MAQAPTSVSTMSPSQWIVDVVEAKGVVVGALAGIGGMVAMGMSGQDAVQFGALTALGVSFSDAALTTMGIKTKIGTFVSGYTTFVDPYDFATGAVGVGLLELYLGLSGTPLYWTMGIAGAASLAAPKVTGYVAGMLVPAVAVANGQSA